MLFYYIMPGSDVLVGTQAGVRDASRKTKYRNWSTNLLTRRDQSDIIAAIWVLFAFIFNQIKVPCCYVLACTWLIAFVQAAVRRDKNAQPVGRKLAHGIVPAFRDGWNFIGEP